jgi:hypothetical protein
MTCFGQENFQAAVWKWVHLPKLDMWLSSRMTVRRLYANMSVYSCMTHTALHKSLRRTSAYIYLPEAVKSSWPIHKHHFKWRLHSKCRNIQWSMIRSWY